ncbi:MAG: hypothetical protein SGJ10_04230 [Bacteroidota bacterium]|nr:hypothetical protein [Bacteroidota bacterium]
MKNSIAHSFHIPVMGLGFTIDTPIKVAHFGISSVISIGEDQLVEDMRKHYCECYQLPYIAISEKEEDYRARRITSYLNLVNELVIQSTEILRQQPFIIGSDIMKYFDLLPDNSSERIKYHIMLQTNHKAAKEILQQELRSSICAGAIDVNIMSKLNKTNYGKDGSPLPNEYSDALSALRGFALSGLESSVVFSAGYNPRLYSYIESFADFYPNKKGEVKKKIILKVSDYRSAVTQGKILAKKGLWISEYRIESGLNCGGHAFATEGLLLGPILEEFKLNREELAQELYTICNQSLVLNQKNSYPTIPDLKITVQGGIGTSFENKLLMEYYDINGTGWGSPFLLVPEATNVDEETLQQLANAKQDDYYLSNSSPLGIPFNNFRKTSSEKQRLQRIAKGKPGSPCYRKFLSSNTEFTEKPICTASRQYQNLKLKQLKEQDLSADEFKKVYNEITEKDCLCTGLSSSAFLKNNIVPKHHLTAVVICPGPNLAYFSGVFTLKQMVDHIYGRVNILNSVKRPNMFVNELGMYVEYLKKEIDKNMNSLNNNKIRYLKTFQSNLLEGVNYYKNMKSNIIKELEGFKNEMNQELSKWESAINGLMIPVQV